MRTATDIVSMRLAILYTLADLERANGMKITSAVEDYADSDLGKDRVYPVLYDLRDDGLISQGKRNPTRGQFWLTDEGRERVEAHHEWASECLDESTGQQKLQD